jgi:hypothetical protein
MIQQIQNSERFLTEYSDFQNRISQINDQDLQHVLTSKLIRLKELVVLLDGEHEVMLATKRLSGEMEEFRNEIGTVRRFLFDTLKSWEKSNLND